MGSSVSVSRDADDVEMAPLRQRRRQQTQSTTVPARTPGSTSTSSIKVETFGAETDHRTSLLSKLLWIVRWTVRCCCFVVLCLIVLLLVLLTMVVWSKNRTQGLLGRHHKSFSYQQYPEQQGSFTRIGSYELLQTVPHDTRAFTQGLVVVAADQDGELVMFEGTGRHGRSELRLLDVNTGRRLQYVKLLDEYFGEGVAHFRVDDELRLVQLTWKEQTAFEYHVIVEKDKQQHSKMLLLPLANWTFHTTLDEGWGITFAKSSSSSSSSSSSDDRKDVFYVTDGSPNLHTWDMESKQQIRKVTVQYRRLDMPQPKQVYYLNELEWDPATSTILMNVWNEDLLLRVDPNTGFVQTIYDLSTLFPKGERSFRTDVMNGVALTYDSTMPMAQEMTKPDEVWVTGKLWPKRYRIRLIDPD